MKFILGFLGRFLSSKYLIPLSKLSNCILMIHPLITRVIILDSEQTFHLSLAILVSTPRKSDLMNKVFAKTLCRLYSSWQRTLVFWFYPFLVALYFTCSSRHHWHHCCRTFTTRTWNNKIKLFSILLNKSRILILLNKLFEFRESTSVWLRVCSRLSYFNLHTTWWKNLNKIFFLRNVIHMELIAWFHKTHSTYALKLIWKYRSYKKDIDHFLICTS